MPVIATDILVKTAIEMAIADLRKNSWLLDDIFGGLATDPLASLDYGFKEVDQAKKWFTSNAIPVYLHARVDSPTFPCITVVQASSSEAIDRTSLGDYGREEEMHPKHAIRQPQKVYSEFSPQAYDVITGTVTLPQHLNTGNIIKGQFLVSQKSGKTYKIEEVVSINSFRIAPNIYDDFFGAYIVPPSVLWNVSREVSFFNESFAIGCHAQSDPVQCIWLRQVIMYILLRYKEVFLEARGFELSTITAQAMDINPHFEAEKVYSAVINLSGTVEGSWIKYIAPKIQGFTSMSVKDPNATGEPITSSKVNAVQNPEIIVTSPGVKPSNFEEGIHISDAPATPEGFKTEVENQDWDMAADLPFLGDGNEEN